MTNVDFIRVDSEGSEWKIRGVLTNTKNYPFTPTGLPKYFITADIVHKGEVIKDSSKSYRLLSAKPVLISNYVFDHYECKIKEVS